MLALVLGLAGAACAPAVQPGGHEASSRSAGVAEERDGPPSRSGREAYPTIEVAPLPGWPKWLGEVNHQISGLAFRDGRLYAVSDQSGVETRTILEIDLPTAGASSRQVTVRAHCHWQGGPHPDAEGLALAPASGPPRVAVMPLESHADALIEIGFDDCTLLRTFGTLTGRDDNQGIEGVALSPDGRTVYLVHETERTLLTLPRGQPGPARRLATISDAESLCDLAYDDRGTPPTEDDRLLLLDRNAHQVFEVTLAGGVVGRWHLSRWPLQTDPDGYNYTLVSLEGLAIESREPDGSLHVYASTDTPPEPFPYRRTKGPKDKEGFYERRVGMLYRFRLPPLK